MLAVVVVWSPRAAVDGPPVHDETSGTPGGVHESMTPFSMAQHGSEAGERLYSVAAV
jgi:hypothetical protein